MPEALHRLLFGVIDYAGLFPPAQHSMRQAVAEFARHLRTPGEAWVMDKFVCPATRLPELAAELEALGGDEEFGVAVVGSFAGTEFAANLDADRRLMDAFDQRLEGRVCVAGYESKGPDDLKAALGALRPLGNLDVFIEVPMGPTCADKLHLLAQTEGVGAKGRTGGLTEEAFPSVEDLAGFLHECYALELDHKLTAGLHHPFRRAPMHGFLNVLVGAALLVDLDLTRAQLARVLASETASEFHIEADRVGWQDLHAGLEAIEEMRGALGSYGSCSVSEPLEDLAALGLLGEVVR